MLINIVGEAKLDGVHVHIIAVT